MAAEPSFDVVIAGGGVAGVAAAAALVEFGYRILIVEPGLDASKRLAGELMHPPGVADLADLGLLPCLERVGGASVHGFAVFHGAGSPAPHCRLPYADIRGLKNMGFALEHGALRELLLCAVERLPGVTLWKGARVSAVELGSRDSLTVTVSGDNRSCRLRPLLLVAADGSGSRVRTMAGIGHRSSRISTLTGYLLQGAHLPQPGYGHVFLSRRTPALAYQLSPDTTRVMFDLREKSPAMRDLRIDAAGLETMPEPFYSEVGAAIETQAPLTSASYCIVPDRMFQGRVVLVGDAGGSCHPLTATGLSVCTRDAMRLRQALRERNGEIPAALRRYAGLRKGPNRTRLTLAQALYQAFTSPATEMGLLRKGLLRYWERSDSGRAASMALLATQETRMSVMAREYARVAWYALQDTESVSSRVQVGLALLLETAKYAGQAVKGLPEEIHVS
jgi:2-polyprenyl-6-methoxyphenol hydroxylase-like FAD-dependent oxidoreductase